MAFAPAADSSTDAPEPRGLWAPAARSRLIAALTRATIVVEAGTRSGALNTADWAQAMGRPVLAVPGPASSPMSRGTHRLIREGVATPIQDATEVITALERTFP